MKIFEKPDDKTLYQEHPSPFDLLEISTDGKSISELYRELNFLAREHFVEYCYLSKKNFTYRKFINTNFYSRYFYLQQHLNGLAYWLFGGQDNLPMELQLLMNEKPNYDNPWGVRVHSKSLKIRKIFKEKE